MNEYGIQQVLEFLGVYYPSLTVRQGDFLISPCPFASVFHKGGIDRNPSFGVAIVEDGNSYFKCFSCKQKGPLFMLPDYVARYLRGQVKGDAEGMFFVHQLEADHLRQIEVRPKTKIDMARISPEALQEEAYANLYEPAWERPESRMYLQERGISQEACQYMGLGYDQDTCRIVFPVRGIDGKLYGFSGRTVFNNFVNKQYPKVKDYYGFKKKHFLLGEHHVEKKATLIVEGLFGYASLVSKGVLELCNVMALLGSEMTPEKVEKLLKTRTSIYLMLDDDEGGHIGTYGQGNHKGAVHQLYNLCSLFVPKWPEGKNDPDQLTYSDIEIILSETLPYIIA